MWLTDRLFRKQGRHARAPTVRPRGFQTALSTKEKWQLVAEWAVLSGVGAWLFYDSWWALLPLAVCFPFYRRFRREALLRKRRMRYASEFQEGMQAMAASIRAGDSAERAVLEALKDLRSIHGKDTAMMEELELMTRELSMNRTPEQLLSELADRSGWRMRSVLRIFSCGQAYWGQSGTDYGTDGGHYGGAGNGAERDRSADGGQKI